MAEILVNGGGTGASLLIKPYPPRGVLKAHRNLEYIRAGLRHFQQAFLASTEDPESLRETFREYKELRFKYVEILKSCATALSEDVGAMPDEQQKYYSSVLTFLSRASDAHSVIPFDMYLQYYADLLTHPDDISGCPELRSIPSLRGFIEDRIAESIMICDAYYLLLSGSFGASMRFFSPRDMLSEILSIRREVSILRRAEQTGWHGPDNLNTLQKMVEQHDRVGGVLSDLPVVGRIYGIPELTYFLIQQIVGNAFKATFGAYWFQQIHTSTALAPEYASLLAMEDPCVAVSISRPSVHTVHLLVRDNGIGVPPGMLRQLVLPEAGQQLSVFRRFQVSNGSSTRLFPFLSDLLGIEMHLASEGVGQGLAVELMIPTNLIRASENMVRMANSAGSAGGRANAVGGTDGS